MSGNLVELHKLLKNMLKERDSTSISGVDFLNGVKDSWKGDKKLSNVFTDAMNKGYITELQNGEIQPCTELQLKRLAETPSEEEKEKEREDQTPVQVPPEAPPKFDGPGEYYQLSHIQLGLLIVRTEKEPEEWKLMKNLSGKVFFENFWFLQDETPMVKQVRDRAGQISNLTVPRLRIRRSYRGAYVSVESITFMCQMNRETDPLVHEAMRFENRVIALGKADSQ